MIGGLIIAVAVLGAPPAGALPLCNYGTLRFPVASQSVENCSICYTTAFGPFSNRGGHTIHGNDPTASSVSCLCFRCAPSAIPGFIVSRIVDAVKRMLLRWSKADVCNEVFKRMPPSLAYSNSTRSISLVRRNILVVATVAHMTPCTVFLGVSQAMLSVCCADSLGSKAPATANSPRLQMRSGNYGALSATAFAHPGSMQTDVISSMQNSESPKLLASNVYEASLFSTRICASHEKPFLSKGNGMVRPSAAFASPLLGCFIIAVLAFRRNVIAVFCLAVLIADASFAAPPSNALALSDIRVRDGDTIVCSINLPLDITLRDEVVRAGDYDACETSRTRRSVNVTPEEIKIGKKAKADLIKLVAESKQIWFVPYAKRDVYGRRLGKLYADDLSLADWARINGFLRPKK